MPHNPRVKLFEYGASNAREFWRLITKPDFEEWRALPSPRTAVHVVQSIWGLAEWIAQEKAHPATDFFNLCSELCYICDVANSVKHRGLDRLKTDATEVRLPHAGHLAYSVAGGYGMSAGGYGSIVPVVVLNDNSQIELWTIVEKAFEFLELKLPTDR